MKNSLSNDKLYEKLLNLYTKIDYDFDAYGHIFSYRTSLKNIEHARFSKNKKIQSFSKWFYDNEPDGLYYLGTAIYFMYDDIKYYVSWTHYTIDFINNACRKLREIGASNILINWGYLD